MDPPISDVKGCWVAFFILFKFELNILQENSADPDQTPLYVASDLGLYCLPMSHIKDARLIWVKNRHLI